MMGYSYWLAEIDRIVLNMVFGWLRGNHLFVLTFFFKFQIKKTNI